MRQRVPPSAGCAPEDDLSCFVAVIADLGWFQHAAPEGDILALVLAWPLAYRLRQRRDREDSLSQFVPDPLVALAMSDANGRRMGDDVFRRYGVEPASREPSCAACSKVR